MPATEFLIADLLCLVTHGILKADMFDADGRGEWSILGRVVEFGPRSWAENHCQSATNTDDLDSPKG
jgi:hypothetical protein